MCVESLAWPDGAYSVRSHVIHNTITNDSESESAYLCNKARTREKMASQQERYLTASISSTVVPFAPNARVKVSFRQAHSGLNAPPASGKSADPDDLTQLRPAACALRGGVDHMPHL